MGFDLRMLMLEFASCIGSPGTLGIECHMSCERFAVVGKLLARAACVTMSRCSGLGWVGIENYLTESIFVAVE